MGDVGVARRPGGARAGLLSTQAVSFRRDLAAAVVAMLAGLVLLRLYAGMELAGLLVGVGFVVGAGILLESAVRPYQAHTWTPADRVTLTRLTLIGLVTALVADRLGENAPWVMIALASVALVLDAVDGKIARSTGTESEFGARFDMEADAFLILVLSIFVAMTMGGWVLAIGAMRYAYVAASWGLRWLRLPVPPSYARKVVAAAQAITLLVVSAALLPAAVEVGAVALALILLLLSFVQCGWWQWRHRANA